MKKIAKIFKKQIDKIAGFSLFETALTMAIFASIITVGITNYALKKDSDQLANDVKKLSILRTTINNFADNNGYIPCPARTDLSSTNSSYLTEARNTTSGYCNESVSGLEKLDVDSLTTYGDGKFPAPFVHEFFKGVVPCRTLGLSDDCAIDSKGNRYSYIVSNAVTKSETCIYYLKDDLSMQTHAYTLKILGNAVPTDSLATNYSNYGKYSVETNEPVYAIVSHGEGIGAYNKNGIKNTATEVTTGSYLDNYYNSLNHHSYSGSSIRYLLSPDKPINNPDSSISSNQNPIVFGDIVVWGRPSGLTLKTCVHCRTCDTENKNSSIKVDNFVSCIASANSLCQCGDDLECDTGAGECCNETLGECSVLACSGLTVACVVGPCDGGDLPYSGPTTVATCGSVVADIAIGTVLFSGTTPTTTRPFKFIYDGAFQDGALCRPRFKIEFEDVCHIITQSPAIDGFSDTSAKITYYTDATESNVYGATYVASSSSGTLSYASTSTSSGSLVGQIATLMNYVEGGVNKSYGFTSDVTNNDIYRGYTFEKNDSSATYNCPMDFLKYCAIQTDCALPTERCCDDQCTTNLPCNCDSDDDCLADESCLGGICVEEDGVCTSDANCGGGQCCCPGTPPLSCSHSCSLGSTTTGTACNDTMTCNGTPCNGNAGDDTITAIGSSTTYGGDGGDTITINKSSGQGVVYGGNGNDIINCSNPSGSTAIRDFCYGEAGDDIITIGGSAKDGSNADSGFGGDDNDQIIFANSNINYVDAGAGNDIIVGSTGNDSSVDTFACGWCAVVTNYNKPVSGGDGDDFIYGDGASSGSSSSGACATSTSTSTSTSSGVSSTTTSGSFTPSSTSTSSTTSTSTSTSSGNDSLAGGSGNDTIFGGPGNDLIFSDVTTDWSSSGVSVSSDGSGHFNNYYPGDGSDILVLGAGDDYIHVAGLWGTDVVVSFGTSSGNGTDAIFVPDLPNTTITRNITCDGVSGSSRVQDNCGNTICVRSNLSVFGCTSGTQNVFQTSSTSCSTSSSTSTSTSTSSTSSSTSSSSGCIVNSNCSSGQCCCPGSIPRSCGSTCTTPSNTNIGTDCGDTMTYTGTSNLFSYAGNDTITVNNNVRTYSGNGNDTIYMNGTSNILCEVFELTYCSETNKCDVNGSTGSTCTGDDYIESTGTKNDRIYSGAGNDTIYAGAGDDTVYSGDGNDIIYTGLGADNVFGEAGNDTIYVSGDFNIAYGQDGNDTISISSASSTSLNTIYGGEGNDTITGADSEDWIYVGAGDNNVYPGTGEANDYVYLTGGNSSNTNNVYIYSDLGGSNTGTVVLCGGSKDRIYYDIPTSGAAIYKVYSFDPNLDRIYVPDLSSIVIDEYLDNGVRIARITISSGSLEILLYNYFASHLFTSGSNQNVFEVP
ncbi:MAG: calcium-binding protein [Rickettsiales bacterium]|nr:calcium-binding protein [Rickettsiales bacterium]